MNDETPNFRFFGGTKMFTRKYWTRPSNIIRFNWIRGKLMKTKKTVK